MSDPLAISDTSKLPFILFFIGAFFVNSLWAEKADDVKKRSFEIINEGVSLYNKGEYWDAAQRLTKASNMALNSFLAYYYLGLSLYASKNYPEAVEPLKVAIDLDPKHLQSHIALGDTYLKLGDHEAALAEYYSALLISPNYAPAYDGIGRYYESTADKEKAIENFKKALELNKGYAEAYLHMGDLYLRDGNLDEAIKYLSEAVQIRPDFPEGLNRLGTAFAKLKLYSKALTVIKKALTLAPKDAAHYQALGEIHLELRQLKQATSYFEKALSLDQSMIDAYIGLAEISRLKGDYGSAQTMLKKAGEVKLADPQVLAKIRKLKKSYEGENLSLNNLMKELEAGTADTEKIRELARLHASTGNFSSAASILSKSPELSQQKAMMEEYGYYLLKSGQFAEASKILEELINAFGPDAKIFINTGISYSEIGNYEKAAQYFSRALALEPENLHAILFLANADFREGKIEEAEKMYAHYIGKGGTGADAERVKKIIELLKVQK